MKIALHLWPLLFFMTPALASGNHLVNLLNSFNQRGVETKVPQSCEEIGSKEKLALICARDLCGDPKTAPTAELNDETIVGIVDQEQYAKILPYEDKLKKIIERRSKEGNLILKAWRERLAKGEKLSLEGLDEDKLETIFGYTLSQHLTVDIDKERPLDERVKVTLSETDFLSAETKSLLQAMIPEYSKKPTAHFTTACYMDVYTLDELKVELKRRAELIKADFDQALIKFPTLLADSLTQVKEHLALAMSGEMNEVLACEISMSLSTIDYTLASVESRERIFPDKNLKSCASDTCREALGRYVNELNWSKLMDSMEKSLNEPRLVEKQLSYCRSMMAELTLLDADASFIRENIPKVKDAFISRALGKYSETSRQKVQKYFDEQLNVVLKSPPKGATAIDDFLEEIDEEAAKEESSSDLSDLYTLLTNTTDKLSIYDMSADAFQGNVCPTSMSYTIWDAFVEQKHFEAEGMPSDAVADKDNILVSHFSCTHPALGMDILAHELGHAFSITAAKDPLSGESMKQFQKDRACINRWEEAEPLPEGEYPWVHPGDQLRSEEDMADLLAFRASSNPSGIFSCALLDKSVDGLEYEGASIVNPISIDSHSSGLTRSLREAIHKGLPLSTACEELIQTEPTVRFHLCL